MSQNAPHDLDETLMSSMPSSAGVPSPGESPTATLGPSTRPLRESAMPQVPGYEILGELGRGGMGVVYQARQLALGRIVALKMILAGSHAAPDDLQLFRAEAEKMARLQHAHIVQVYEIGEHQGLPYFSLEFCAGGSLHHKLQGTPLKPRDAARLLETLARAVAVAHDKQLVHRDLKPHNVLLDEHGEPKIADFGLARRLDAAGQTQTGTIKGTASYMAPEQARGERVGPLADVYGLGAVLYELLTGRPPFLADNTVAILGQVLFQEPVPVRRLQPAAPRDLETICLCCLHKVAHRRYPSALALAEDLRRYQAGEPIVARPVGRLERAWKWARRRPAVASLAALLIVAVAVGFALVTWKWQDESAARALAESNEQIANEQRDAATVARDKESLARQEEERAKKKEADARQLAEDQKKEAFRQRDFARKYFKKAQDAVKTLLVESSQDPDYLRDVPGLAVVRRKLLEKALLAQQGFLEDQSDDPVVREAAGYTYMLVAELQTEQEHFDKADAAFQQGLAIFQRLAAQFPESQDYRAALAASHYAFGNYLRQRERYAEAVQQMSKAIAIDQDLVGQFPDNLEYVFELATAHDGLGMTHFQAGAEADAEKHLLTAGQYQKKLLARWPPNPLHVFGASMTQANLSATLSAKRPKEAVPHARKALELRLSLYALTPTNVDVRKAVAQSRLALAAALALSGNLEEGEKHYRDALADLQKLHDEFPTNGYFQVNLAQTHSSLGALLLKEKRYDEAEKQLRLALPLQEKLLQQLPDHWYRRGNLALTHKMLGEVLQHLDRFDEAEKHYRIALQQYQKLNTAPSPGKDDRDIEVETAINLGTLLMERGQLAESEQLYRSAVALQEQCVKEHPDDADSRMTLSLVCNNLGSVLAESGRLEEARTWQEKTVAMRKELAAQFPDNLRYRFRLGQAYVNLGSGDVQRQQFKTGEKHLRDALTILEELPAEFTGTVEYRTSLQKIHVGLTQVLNADGSPDAEKHARKAVELGELLLHDLPNNPTIRKDLAMCHYNLAIWLRNARSYEEAEKHFTQAVGMYEKLVGEMPKVSGLRFDLAKTYFNVGWQHLMREQWTQAETAMRQGQRLTRELVATSPSVVEFQQVHKSIEGMLATLRQRLVQKAAEYQKQKDWKPLRATLEELVAFDRRSLKEDPDSSAARGQLGFNCFRLAYVCVELQDHAAAAKLAAEFPRYKDDVAKIWLASASLLGECMFLARSDTAFNVEQRSTASKAYGDLAMESLRQAVKLGFKDAKLLQEANDFAFLRDREDFQELIRNLELKKD
jgi:tetratricopeptide (TPR) repeat protein